LIKYGNSGLLRILNINDENDCIKKIDLIPILVEVSKSDLIDIATSMQIPIDYKKNRGELSRYIIASGTLEEIKFHFIKISNKNNIVIVNSEGRILGPEWITNLFNKDINAAKAFVSFFNNLDINIIKTIGYSLNIKGESKAVITQKMISKYDPIFILAKISDLIIEKSINIENLKGEYTWDIDIDSRYGLRYSTNSPINNLCKILLLEYPEPQFDKYLRHPNLNYLDRMFIFCIENEPYKIIEEHISTKQLENIIKNQFLINNYPIDRTELINLLLFHLGFDVPEKPIGLRHYEDCIRKWNFESRKELDKDAIRGISTSLFVETEKLIKDMIYYYCGCFIKNVDTNAGYVFGDYEGSKYTEILGLLLDKPKEEIRPINKLMIGELLSILSKINNNSSLLTINLNRDKIIPNGNKTINILSEMNKNRSYFVHDSEHPQNEPKKDTLKKVIINAEKLIKEMKFIYPTSIIVTKLEKTGYKTTYIIAKDEEMNDYKIYLDEYLGDDVFKNVYFMAYTEEHIIVNPILVRKMNL